MDPTLLCAIALIAADPGFDLPAPSGESPPHVHTSAYEALSFGWSEPAPARLTSYRSPQALQTSATDAADDSDDLLPVDSVFRGQSPTYAQPVDPYLQPPQSFGAPGAATVYPLQAPGPHFFAVYENVIVAPFFSQNTSSVSGAPGPGPPGPPLAAMSVRQFDWDFEYSPRFEIGMVDGEGAGWRARYWHFDHSNDDSVTAAPGTMVFISPDAITGLGIMAVAGQTAQSSHSLRMSVLDAEFLKRGVGDRGFDFSFGLRYARMDQWLRGRVFNAAGVQIANNSVHHDFEGLGPTIATEYHRPLWWSNWGVFGNARASLLYGDSNYRYDRRNAAGVLTANSQNNGDADLLGVVEMQIGLEYRVPVFCTHEFVFRAALEAQYWANAGSASADLGFTTDNSQDADLGFLGANISTGLTW